MKVHAGYALNIGVPEEELTEVIYMVIAPVGFPKAIVVSFQTMSDLFRERREVNGSKPAGERQATTLEENLP